MILRYVSRVLVCKLHPSRVAQRPLFPEGRFNNKSTLSRPLFSSASAFSFSFPFLSFSLSFFFFSFPSFISVVAEKAFRDAVENALHDTVGRLYIVKYTRRCNYEMVDLCCLLRAAFYGRLIKLQTNYQSANY